MIITSAHFRTIPGFSPRVGFCASGGREWFKRHGLDWRAFLRNGISEEQLLATGDAFAQAIVAHARQEAGNGQ